jgi:hypothetical protein
MTDSVVFAAPWDQKLTALTVLVGSLMLGATVLTAWLAIARVSSGPLRAVLLAGAIVPLAALVLGALMAPRGYAIRGGILTIERFIGPIEIPLESIQEVGILPAERLDGSLRTLGTGGYFGYYGRFRNERLGAYRLYATRGDGYVLVRAGRPYILTPDAPERFVEALNRGRRGAAGLAGPQPPPAAFRETR